jgi:hypothetical protein
MSEKTCIMCLRTPGSVNNAVSECSLPHCPHRRHCWSEGTDAYPAGDTWHDDHPLDHLFDRVDGEHEEEEETADEQV